MGCLNWYKCIENNDDLHAFVIRHSPLIKKIANHIKCRLPGNIETDDLLQAGLIGLLEAKNNYSTNTGAAFETYASIRIRGAIIDELRRTTGITRDISQNIKNISTARSQLENDTQNSGLISAKDIASKMGITEKRYSNIMAEINAYTHISMSEVDTLEQIPCSKSMNPMESIEREDIKTLLKSVIYGFPQREQQILALYYNEELNFKEIAEILELTEARVSQLHALLLSKIRSKLSGCR